METTYYRFSKRSRPPQIPGVRDLATTSTTFLILTRGRLYVHSVTTTTYYRVCMLLQQRGAACLADPLLYFIVSASFTLLTFAFQRVGKSFILGVGNIRRLLLPCCGNGRGSLDYLVDNITTTNYLCARFPGSLGEQV